jgi:hypothetical protein
MAKLRIPVSISIVLLAISASDPAHIRKKKFLYSVKKKMEKVD